jgi:Helix-turn-helix domain
MKTQDVFGSLSSAARYSNISRQTLAKHLGSIAHRRVGKKVVITKTSLDRWLEGQDKNDETDLPRAA